MDHPNSPSGSSDWDYWKTILSMAIGSGLLYIGQFLTDRRQTKMEKFKWEREDKIQEKVQEKESDSAILRSIYPVLLTLYSEAVKLRPGVGGNLSGSLQVNTSPKTPSESFMKTAQALIDFDRSVFFLDSELSLKSRKLIVSLESFLQDTLKLANQRASGTPGATMVNSIKMQTESLNQFLNESSSFFKAASQKIGFHRFGLPSDIQTDIQKNSIRI